VVWSVVGPASFALAAARGSRLVPGYSRRDEPISALAAKGSPAARVMVPGFLALSLGTLGLARDVRGSAAAPPPVPAMLGAASLAIAGAGLARCSDRTCPTRLLGDSDVTLSDDLHAAFSAATFGLWIAIPLVAAKKAEAAGDRYRRWSRRLGGFTATTLVISGLLARTSSERWSGWAQRVMLASALAWYPLAGVTASRRRTVSG